MGPPHSAMLIGVCQTDQAGETQNHGASCPASLEESGLEAKRQTQSAHRGCERDQNGECNRGCARHNTTTLSSPRPVILLLPGLTIDRHEEQLTHPKNRAADRGLNPVGQCAWFSNVFGGVWQSGS
eukprot:c14778_g1_i2.p2 GENE.c14778_g1_i2~~c14778_g1_i2.p2  ORF type:complete len:126 (+),score=14.68 c14778_g1_i2:194-571(+)